MEIGLVFSSSSIAKSIAREEGIPGRSSRNTYGNSFTTGTYSRVFSFPLTSTEHANIVQLPCWTNLFAFITETTFGVVRVLVPLNLKVGLADGENSTSFLRQSILAQFSASQSMPSITSKSVIFTIIKSMLIVWFPTITWSFFTLSLATRSTPTGVLIDNSCNKSSSSNLVYTTKDIEIKECVEPESYKVKAK